MEEPKTTGFAKEATFKSLSGKKPSKAKHRDPSLTRQQQMVERKIARMGRVSDREMTSQELDSQMTEQMWRKSPTFGKREQERRIRQMSGS